MYMIFVSLMCAHQRSLVLYVCRSTRYALACLCAFALRARTKENDARDHLSSQEWRTSQAQSVSSPATTRWMGSRTSVIICLRAPSCAVLFVRPGLLRCRWLVMMHCKLQFKIIEFKPIHLWGLSKSHLVVSASSSWSSALWAPFRPLLLFTRIKFNFRGTRWLWPIKVSITIVVVVDEDDDDHYYY